MQFPWLHLNWRGDPIGAGGRLSADEVIAGVDEFKRAANERDERDRRRRALKLADEFLPALAEVLLGTEEFSVRTVDAHRIMEVDGVTFALEPHEGRLLVTSNTRLPNVEITLNEILLSPDDIMRILGYMELVRRPVARSAFWGESGSARVG